VLDDEIAAALAAARERALASVNEVLPEVGPHAAHELGTLHGELLKALGALVAVLAMHEPQLTANGIPVCAFCSRAIGTVATAPCGHASAILAALPGEGKADE